MAGFLLDTNVVSELRRRAPHPNVLAWHDRHRDAEVYLSVLVIGEIRQGIERLRPRDPTRAAGLETWLDGLLRSYQHRLLPVTTRIAEEWGRIGGSRRPVIDGLMAATAKVHRLTLVTRNMADVRLPGVRVIDPFTARR